MPHFIFTIKLINILGQDCRNFPELCSPDASCVDTGKKIFKDWERWYWKFWIFIYLTYFYIFWPFLSIRSCACNEGFVGNGITCVKKSDGLLSQPLPDQASMQMIVTTEFINTPDDTNDLMGPNDNDLITDMEDMLDTGILCSGCNDTIATCAAWKWWKYYVYLFLVNQWLK